MATIYGTYEVGPLARQAQEGLEQWRQSGPGAGASAETACPTPGRQHVYEDPIRARLEAAIKLAELQLAERQRAALRFESPTVREVRVVREAEQIARDADIAYSQFY